MCERGRAGEHAGVLSLIRRPQTVPDHQHGLLIRSPHLLDLGRRGTGGVTTWGDGELASSEVAADNEARPPPVFVVEANR